jgi:FAD/FMN-containing dehydrogenase
MERRSFLKAGLALAGAALSSAGALGAVSPVTAQRLGSLGDRLKGRLILPGAPDYHLYSQLWNARYEDVLPAAIVMAADEADVAAAIVLARGEGLDFVLRSGGHSFAGFSTTPGIVIDVRGLTTVAVDTAAATARVGPGMTNLPLYEALWPYRMAVPAGTCPTVGIAGLALGGGFGRLSPIHGLTSDNLLGLRLIDAEGKVAVVDEKQNPDLLWASRGGGGGNFGAVTELTFRLQPVDMPFTNVDYTFAWPAALKVLRAWQQWTADRPPQGHGYLQLITGAPADGATISVELTFAGDPEQAKALARDFIAATGNDPIRTRELSGSFVSTERDWLCAGLRPEECGYAGVTPGGTIPRYALSGKSDFVRSPWPDEGLGLLIEALGRRQADRVLTPPDFQPGVHDGKVLMEVCGGAIDRIGPADTAFAHRGMLYLSQYQARWLPGAAPSVVAANVDWVRAMFASVAPYRSGASYVNYADRDLADWPEAYYGANLDRLRRIKAKVDPDYVFRFPQSIAPA